MKSPLIPGFPIWLFHINLGIYFIYIWVLSYVYGLHYATASIQSKIYIALYKFSSDIGITEKVKAGKNYFVAVAYMWLFHLFLCCIYHFLLSFSRFSERIWEYMRNKSINQKFCLNSIKTDKLL